MSTIYTCHAAGCSKTSNEDETLKDYFLCEKHFAEIEMQEQEAMASKEFICGDCLAPIEPNHPCLTAY